jgi:hypothetical protein
LSTLKKDCGWWLIDEIEVIERPSPVGLYVAAQHVESFAKAVIAIVRS